MTHFIKYGTYLVFTYAGAHAVHDLYRIGGNLVARFKSRNVVDEIPADAKSASTDTSVPAEQVAA